MSTAKPKTWRERLPRWMGGKVAEIKGASYRERLEQRLTGADIDRALRTAEAENATVYGNVFDHVKPRAVPVRRARYETCMDCNDTVDAWRTYADGTRRCLPCDQAVR